MEFYTPGFILKVDNHLFVEDKGHPKGPTGHAIHFHDKFRSFFCGFLTQVLHRYCWVKFFFTRETPRLVQDRREALALCWNTTYEEL